MIFHITSKQEWELALQKAQYEATSLHTEGFIHLSKIEQVSGVLERYYQGVNDLVMLHVDENLLTSPLKFELSPSINQEFPHLYGPLNINAVVNVEPIPNS